jgi:hypothetical protein
MDQIGSDLVWFGLVCLIAFTFFTVLLSAAVLIAAPHVIVG